MIEYLVGDVRARMGGIPDGSVSLVTCSPPFIALRSYLPDDHPDKALEIGSEPDPASFIHVLLDLTAEWGRVLAPWGSIAIELGDTFAGSGGGGGDYAEGGMRDGQPGFLGSARRSQFDDPKYKGRTSQGSGSGSGSGWPQAKCLALVPQLYACSLAYGRNVLTGEESPAGQWLVRNVVVWHRPNPAVGALGDKYRPATSYITVATRSPSRWFDLSAVRHPADPANKRPSALKRQGIGGRSDQVCNPLGDDGQRIIANAAGAPPQDCWSDPQDDGHETWSMTTQPSKIAHYAMWPAKLAERIVLSMCPAEVCTVCDEPRRRIEGDATYARTDSDRVPARLVATEGERIAGGVNQHHMANGANTSVIRSAPTLGWTHCGCNGGTPTTWRVVEEESVDVNGDMVVKRRKVIDDLGSSVDPYQYRPGRVLDPFAGTGTTLCVAELHGRDSTGVDIDERNELLVAARMDECRKTLFGTAVEMPGSLSLFELDEALS